MFRPLAIRLCDVCLEIIEFSTKLLGVSIGGGHTNALYIHRDLMEVLEIS
jgi:hypothetical protein